MIFIWPWKTFSWRFFHELVKLFHLHDLFLNLPKLLSSRVHLSCKQLFFSWFFLDHGKIILHHSQTLEKLASPWLFLNPAHNIFITWSRHSSRTKLWTSWQRFSWFSQKHYFTDDFFNFTKIVFQCFLCVGPNIRNWPSILDHWPAALVVGRLGWRLPHQL